MRGVGFGVSRSYGNWRKIPLYPLLFCSDVKLDDFFCFSLACVYVNIYVIRIMGYTKLFSSILASSIWQEDLATKIVWITMLALKNERHEVEASLPGLANLAGVTMKECEAAVKKFESPDKYSRNQGHEGRKVERCISGWRILNGDYYSHLLSADERRAYQREYQKEYRKRRKEMANNGACDGAKQAIHDGFADLTGSGDVR